MTLVGGLHARLVFRRRIRVLASHIAPFSPAAPRYWMSAAAMDSWGAPFARCARM